MSLRGYFSFIFFLLLTNPGSLLEAQEPLSPIIEPVHTLNSPARETNVALTADGKTIYFTSLRGGCVHNQITGFFQGQPVFDGDIFFATRPDTSSPWSGVRRLPPGVCSELTQDDVQVDPGINPELTQDEVHVHPDGGLITFQTWSHSWRTVGGPYYELEVNGPGDWKTPRPLGGSITRFFIETGFLATDGMTRTPDGSIIFAAGPTYDSPMDLYYARRMSDGRFVEVVRLPCSTEYDERSVFLAADSITLYFSSNRPNGFGGLDIYKATLREDWTVGEARNIGAPYNTANDEYGMVIHTQNEAYFIRDGDIFRATHNTGAALPTVPFRQPEDPVMKLEDPPVTIQPAIPPSVVPRPQQPLSFAKTNNVVFILDRSNSMDEPNKLPILVASFKGLAPFFRREDRLSLITFADQPEVLFNGMEGDNTQFFLDRFSALRAGGHTNGKDALDLGLSLTENNSVAEGNNVAIFATDGRMELEKLYPIARSFARKNLRLIVLSYGNPGRETTAKLENLAKLGNGWHRTVNNQNIDTVLEEALLATRDGR